MKKWTTLNVNGTVFEYNTVNKVADVSIGYRDIDDVYNRPSETKCDIWRRWDSWFCANNGYCSIKGYNCNFFSIHGYFEYDNEKYYAIITHGHNKCWKVGEV